MRHQHYAPPPTEPPSLFDLPPAFKGETFSEPLDQERLERALDKVKRALETRAVWTLAELAHVAGCSESGARARISNCRMGYRMVVDSKRIAKGLWSYQFTGEYRT